MRAIAVDEFLREQRAIRALLEAYAAFVAPYPVIANAVAPEEYVRANLPEYLRARQPHEARPLGRASRLCQDCDYFVDNREVHP